MRETPASLVHMAELAGVHVEWTRDVATGDYGSGLIRINPRLSDERATVVLAHELGHHYCGPTERAADAYAAGLLVDPDDYADAEQLYEGHAGAIARELGVTVAMIEAWQRKGA